jgi:RND family efflux transporter MFP subunit
MSRRGVIVLAVALSALGTLIALRLLGGDGGAGPSRRGGPAAVEAAPVERGAIELRRTFTGTLEARGRFIVAANVGGRVERLLVDLADPVSQGQVIAELDGAEEVQGVAEAAAEVAVARANVADAESALEIAERERARVDDLGKRGVVSESEVDAAKSRHLARTTAVKVAKAQLERAGAAHRRARIRSNYTSVIAVWSGDSDTRFVAERHVAEGDNVAPNDPLITVVDLEPLDAIVHVTEREYGSLRPGQLAAITTDAYPGTAFSGTIRRIAPVFRETSRQARMELEIANPDHLLKPGMFVRAEVVLDRVDDATIVPLGALVTREGKTGVFVLDDAGDRVAWQVAWRPVEVGIQHGDRVQVVGEGVAGRVVTLGQQLIDDGSAVTVPERAAAPVPEGS